MRVGREVLRDLQAATKLEWLQTDGLGGFAMGTAAGMNTRRYHGWCVSQRPPVERYVLVSRLEESVDGIELGVNQYPGTIHPRGHERLVSFESQPCPCWTWELEGGLTVKKWLWLVEGTRTLAVRYEASDVCSLKVKPLLAFRDYHGLQKANAAVDARWQPAGGAVVVKPYDGMPALRIAHEGQLSRESEGWFYSTEYPVEQERGLDYREDLWCLGTLSLTLNPGAQLTFSVGSAPQPVPAPRARDAFRVKRADGRPTLIAGYPWFTDWGRDTMISLPGLLIGRGQLDEAREVIRAFLEHLNQGVIPNRFPDRGEKPEYNTVDATLWMFQAAHALFEAGGDTGFLRDTFFERGREIISWHERGTHFGIRVDPADGLLANGPQTTWMDAVVNGQAVTPRSGKAVEINALWFNALMLMESWAKRLGKQALATEYGAKAARVAAAFRPAFWNPAAKWLCDVVGDASLRPNQLMAASLAHSPLSVADAQAVVKAVEAKLLTPFGLRTLAPGSAGYAGRYEGDPVQRDRAYHQGTVWPWLIGPYVDASLKAFGDARKKKCVAALAPLRGLLEQTGQLPEVFDGDAPHRAGGTPAQAWSVAEVLRALARL